MPRPVHDDLLWNGLSVVSRALGPDRVARTALEIDGDLEATLLLLAARGLTIEEAGQVIGRSPAQIIEVLAADGADAWDRLVHTRL